MDLVGRLGAHVAQHAGRYALWYQTTQGQWQSFTFRQLYEEIQRTAGWLFSLGVNRTDHVVLILENPKQWVIMFFALLSRGAVVVPLDMQMTAQTLKNIVQDASAKWIFFSESVQEKITELSLEIPCMCLDKEGIFVQESLSVAWKEEKAVFASPDDLACIMYTSGTTDIPKGVMLSHENLCTNVDSIGKLHIFSTRDMACGVLPLHHAYSIMASVLAPLLVGGGTVMPASLRAEVLQECLNKFPVTVFPMVPQLLYMIHKGIQEKIKAIPHGKKLALQLLLHCGVFLRERTGINLNKYICHAIHAKFGRKLRYIVSGGANLDKAVERDFFCWGFTVVQGYGLTETAPIVTLNNPRRLRLGSVGRNLPGVKILIQPPQGAIQQEYVDGYPVGEVVISGKNVMQGYYHKEDQTAQCLKNGYFYSGDLGYQDKKGYLYLTGRSKEVIVLSSGKNIYPDEIEKYYMQISCIKELCVIGIQDPGSKTEQLHALILPDLVLLKERGEMNIRQVIGDQLQNFSYTMPSYKRIMGFTIVKEELPRTRLGKLKRHEVVKRYEVLRKAAECAPKVTPKEHISTAHIIQQDPHSVASKVLVCLQKTFTLKEIPSFEDSLELDLGITSLGRIELIDALEKTLGVSFPDALLHIEIFTVKDLVVAVGSFMDGSLTIKEDLSSPSVKHHFSWRSVITKTPPARMLATIRFVPAWFDWVIAWIFVQIVVKGYFALFHGYRVKGRNAIPKERPYLICANHVTYYDAFLISMAVPYRFLMHLFFLGFRAYFTVWGIRRLVKIMRVIPIDLSSHMVEAMQACAYILENKKNLCVFPEGQRSIDGEVKKFKKGIGILVKELQIGIVPVYLKGAYEAWPRTSNSPRFRRPIEVRIGHYCSYAELYQESKSLPHGDIYENIAQVIRKKVVALEEKTGFTDGEGVIHDRQ